MMSKTPFPHRPRLPFTLLKRLRRDQRGNVLMIVGLSIIPLVFATGMGIDYSRAMRLQTRLNAAADASALAAVTQPMMTKTNAQACTAAKNMFLAQSNGLMGLTLDINDPNQFKITLKDNSGVIDCTVSGSSLNTAASFGRTVTVSYRGLSQNAFAGVLGVNSLVVHGLSQSFAAVAPNIDFYLLMDASQSMLLPATSSGLAAMQKATLPQVINNGVKVGCAFACHQTWRGDNSTVGTASKNPKGATNEIATNPKDPADPQHKVLDNYQVARNLGIVLRTDNLAIAVADLMDVAKSTSSKNQATYRMGLTSFDFSFQNLWPTGTGGDRVDANLDTVKTHVADYTIQPYYVNNWRTSSVSDNDVGTASSNAFTTINTQMPAPGGGTKIPNDKPQAILFVITDGMRDEKRSGGKPEGPFDLSLCNTIKSRGIRIAILYTEYLAGSANDLNWSVPNVQKPYLSPTDNISPAMQSCASPGLYYKVSTDDDISAALTALFQQAVSTAKLTQ